MNPLSDRASDDTGRDDIRDGIISLTGRADWAACIEDFEVHPDGVAVFFDTITGPDDVPRVLTLPLGQAA